MTEAELHELIPMHALGALEPAQAEAVDAYLHRNPEALASFNWYLEAAAVLAQSVPQASVPEHVKTRMLGRIRTLRDAAVATPSQMEPSRTGRVRPAARQARPVWRPAFIAGWAALTVALSAVLAVQVWRADASLRALEAAQREVGQLLAASDTRSVRLVAAAGQQAVGRVFVAVDGRVLISHTMTLPAHKTWQAWFIADAKSAPQSLGTTSESRLLVRLPGRVNAVAISEEPEGGSDAPTLVRAIAPL